jgi:hypothetical protein
LLFRLRRLPPNLRHFYIFPSFPKETIDQAQDLGLIDQALRVKFLRHRRGFAAGFGQRSVVARGDISSLHLKNRIGVQARVRAGQPAQ